MALNLKIHLKLHSLHNLMEEESIVVDELAFFAFNIREEVCVVLVLLSFLRKFGEKKAHNMFYLMLDPRFKSFHLVSSFIGRE